MSLYFSLSDIVILGGSFIKMGGHNPIEPAHNNCVVITGPHIYNWENIFIDMINSNACIVCKTIDKLDMPDKCLLVIGSEHSGLRELTKKKCDYYIC